jgi:cation transporter-like permease
VRDFFTVYVIDKGGKLVGRLALQDLILADGADPVETIMEPDVVRVLPVVDQEEVARLIAKYNLVSIPVVDESDQLLGRITVDDVIDIIEAEVTEDIFRLSGVAEQEESYATPIEIIRSRTPWLLVTLCTSGLGALVVAHFESTIQRMAFIVVFMPVVAAMAGNSAVQATAVAVRRLALASHTARPLRSIARELVAGLVIGFLIALIIGIVAGVWRNDVIVGVVIGGSMWGAISLGVLWGAAFPILLDKMGLDPAVSSSVFLSTMTDIVSFLLIVWRHERDLPPVHARLWCGAGHGARRATTKESVWRHHRTVPPSSGDVLFTRQPRYPNVVGRRAGNDVSGDRRVAGTTGSWRPVVSVPACRAARPRTGGGDVRSRSGSAGAVVPHTAREGVAVGDLSSVGSGRSVGCDARARGMRSVRLPGLGVASAIVFSRRWWRRLSAMPA